ncbi:MAG: precorrin-2 C(20)-methyltransferase [Methyloligellaceae bacterium]
MMPGRLYGLGVGPGDPELISMKAFRLLQESDVVAYPTGRDDGGYALAAVDPHLRDDHILLPMKYPATAGAIADSPDYPQLMQDYYDATSDQISTHLDADRDVALICLGDPFFYGSYMYWHSRLAEKYETTVVPGISSVMAGPASLDKPLCHRTDTMTVIPATLPEEDIETRLRAADSAVLMKLGRTLPKVRRVLDRIGRLDQAWLVERATMDDERIVPMTDDTVEKAGYFSIIVIPCATPV